MADASFRLVSDATSGVDTPSRYTWTLINQSHEAISDFKLAVTTLVRIRIGSDVENGRITDQLANYHVVEPSPGFILAPGASWSITADHLSHILRHYTDGPKSAALYLGDGSLATVDVAHMTQNGEPGVPRLTPPMASPLPKGAAPLSVIPHPARVDIHGARALPSALSLGAASAPAAEAYDAVSALARRLFPQEMLFRSGGLPIDTRLRSAMPLDAYLLGFRPDGVDLEAGGTAGFQNGLITLAQMLRGARSRPQDFSFPFAGTIDDQPRFEWRGAHLDVARQVYETGELTRFVDTMAWNKLNRFHFHLNDDEAWRIDIPAYPDLSRRAGFRGPGHDMPPLFGSPFETYGIVYSKEDIAALVAHADMLGIIIVPEVDIPGHCLCVLRALPELADPDEPADSYRAVQYYPNNALNPAREEVYTFLAEVMKTVAELFPSPWIHLGGDEVSDRAWMQSPQALNALKGQNWNDTFGLQSQFLRRVQDMVRDLVRHTGAWDEAAYGGGIDARDTYVVAWQKSEVGLKLAAEGYKVVLAPAEYCYFDMAQSEDWWEPGATWAGHVSVETCYAFDPAQDWPEDLRGNCLGVQSCLWSENLSDKRLFDHMMYPRLSALAETAWTPREKKDFERFSAIQDLMPVTGMR